ncbi:MAG: HAD family hydrolase [Lachnospiraceae bacterium]|nr:HAD family hydrolase [Lachnospiraceae bacterium]
MYKCIFSDLDRTLLNLSGELSDRSKKAISFLKSKGIPFIPATGRAYGSLPECILKNRDINYVITSNGVAAYSLKEGRALWRTTLPAHFVAEFFDFCEKEGLIAIETYLDGIPYTCREFYSDPARYNQSRVEYVKATRKPVDSIREFALSHKDSLDGLTIIAPEGRLQELCEKASALFGDVVYITGSDGLYLEFANLKCGKHNALLKMCDFLGIPSADAIAFGDNDNDVEMLATAGLGICVDNGTESCKSAAGMITHHHDEDGVAGAIEKIFGVTL